MTEESNEFSIERPTDPDDTGELKRFQEAFSMRIRQRVSLVLENRGIRGEPIWRRSRDAALKAILSSGLTLQT